MRVNLDGSIVLSRRNVLTLLHELERPGSARMLIGPDGCIVVRVEGDAEHYNNRPMLPGEMHSETEAFINSYDNRTCKICNRSMRACSDVSGCPEN